MSVSDKFKAFCKSLCLTNRTVISKRYKAITKRLNKDFWGIESETRNSLYTGSYGRGTASEGCSDVDMIMKLPWELFVRHSSHVGNGQSALLQVVRNSIRLTYPSSDIGGDGQVVVVRFSDKTRFEVVPGFEDKDGSFKYPDSNGGGKWRMTNPRPEIKAIADIDKKTNGNLRNLCRMVRAWRDSHSVSMGGLLVDTLCHKFIRSWKHREKSYSQYGLLTADFFAFLAKVDDKKPYWLAPGSGQHVHRKGAFSRKAARAHSLALEALEHEYKDQQWAANKKWGEIYGHTF